MDFAPRPEESATMKERKRKSHTHTHTVGVSVTFDLADSSITGRRGEVCVLSHPSSLGRCVCVCVCSSVAVHTHSADTHVGKLTEITLLF